MNFGGWPTGITQAPTSAFLIPTAISGLMAVEQAMAAGAPPTGWMQALALSLAAVEQAMAAGVPPTGWMQALALRLAAVI